MRTIKELMDFLSTRPDDAEVQICNGPNIQDDAERIAGFYWIEGLSDDPEEPINPKVVLSSYAHF